MIVKALEALRPSAEYSLNAGDYKQLVWLDKEQTKPTAEEINAWILANSQRVLLESELLTLDSKISRFEEDVVQATDITLYGDKAAAKARKDEIRMLLK